MGSYRSLEDGERAGGELVLFELCDLKFADVRLA